MSEPVRTVAELRRLIALARQLGFTDDVEHWEAELKKITDTAGGTHV